MESQFGILSAILFIALLAISYAYIKNIRRWALRTKKATLRNQRLMRVVRERVHAVENLSESQDFLDTIFDNIPNMVFVKEAKGLKFVKMNRAGYNLVGVHPNHLIGKTDRELFPEAQANHFISKDREVLRLGHTLEVENELITTSKGIRHLSTKKIPLFNKQGVPLYLLGISEDITTKKHAEAQRLELLREAAARIEAEKSVLRMGLLGAATTALSSSLDVNLMLGEFAKVVVKSYTPWFIADYYDSLGSVTERSVSVYHASNGGHEAVLSFQHSIGERGGSQSVHQVMKENRGRIFADVTPELLRDLIRDEGYVEAILKSNPTSLAIMPICCAHRCYGVMVYLANQDSMPCGPLDFSMAEDLTRRAALAIDNAQLFARANDANRAKSAFLANMSHEIRTPLGIIMGFADLLSEKQVSQEQVRESAARIKNNGEMLLKVVDEILDLSKVESEQLHLEMVEFSLNRLVDEVFHLFEQKARAKGLKFMVGIVPELDYRIFSDPIRIKQILINIIGNAIKFTDTGYVRVQVCLDEMNNQGDQGSLRFSVVDSGVGVSLAKADKIFQPFVQADNSMTRMFGGAGLGLFLARRLARLLGGDVTLEAKRKNRGSEFNIEIKVTRGSALLPETCFSYIKPSTVEPSSLKSKTQDLCALVVDDAQDNRLLLGTYLQRLNWRFEVAQDGFEALQKITSDDKYKVVLMDIQMPEMDGFEALRKLRSKHFTGPVIAVTAHAMKGDREHCLEAGFDDYISKPVSKLSLQQALERQEQRNQLSAASVSL